MMTEWQIGQRLRCQIWPTFYFFPFVETWSKGNCVENRAPFLGPINNEPHLSWRHLWIVAISEPVTNHKKKCRMIAVAVKFSNGYQKTLILLTFFLSSPWEPSRCRQVGTTTRRHFTLRSCTGRTDRFAFLDPVLKFYLATSHRVSEHI